MGEMILQTDIKRESGYLYYVASDENQNLILFKAKLSRGGKKKENLKNNKEEKIK